MALRLEQMGSCGLASSPELPLPELGDDVATVRRASEAMSELLAGYVMEAPELSGYALEQLIRAGTTQRLDPKYMVPLGYRFLVALRGSGLDRPHRGCPRCAVMATAARRA